MERTTIEKHAYISGRDLYVMSLVGLLIAAAGVFMIVAALQSAAYAGFGLWGWLAMLGGLVMIWGESHEAILEKKAIPMDPFIIWVIGLAIVIGMPCLLIMLLA